MRSGQHRVLSMGCKRHPRSICRWFVQNVQNLHLYLILCLSAFIAARSTAVVGFLCVNVHKHPSVSGLPDLFHMARPKYSTKYSVGVDHLLLREPNLFSLFALFVGGGVEGEKREDALQSSPI